MSSGSTLTLYRKYNKRVSDEEMKSIVERYVESNKQNDHSENKKTDEEYAKDIPIVLNPRHGEEPSVYDEESNTWKDVRDHSIDGQRNSFKFVMSTDGSHMDELLSWNFGSVFNCLKNEWNMDPYNYRGNERIIDIPTAHSLLQACKYVLSGKYNDDFEDILNNKWVKILAEDNDSDSIWEYVFRHNKQKLNEMHDDDDCGLRYNLVSFASALETFVNIEKDYGRDDEYENVLVYSAW